MEAIGIEEARKDLGGIVDRARLKAEHTVITRAGKPAAVVVPVEWYQAARLAFEQCAHCGRTPARGFARGLDNARLCHGAEGPDCYRRVTVYSEPLGALIGVPEPPEGVTAIRRDREEASS